MKISDINTQPGRKFPARRWGRNIAGGPSPIQASTFMSGFVILEPDGGQVPWHNQEQEEVYFIVEGTAQMCLGKEIQTLTKGQAVYIPSGVFHQLSNVSDEPCTFIYIYGPAGDVAHWRQELDGTLPPAGVGDTPSLPEGAWPQCTEKPADA
jgi:mannose-6-phosphate isomerase-like protein (cupin superfamily)